MNQFNPHVFCENSDRRKTLKVFVGLLGGAALSACGGGSDGGDAVAGEVNAGAAPTTAPQTPATVQPQKGPANQLLISLPAGSMSNYPLQFGRAFDKGLVPGEPVVALDGVKLVAQQVDVKTRHEDGSVKFAVISVVIPVLGTTERVLSIANQAVGTARAPERVANMLANYDFEATIGVASATVSARTMLSGLTDTLLAAETAAGGVNSRYWTVGPVCTTVLLCDHTSKVWDVGTNATKAIRPMFHVQFWPGIGKYHVRHIIEVADVTKLKDETGLEVTFTTGHTHPVTRLSQSGAYVYAATFQTRAFWGGADVPRANVKHGVAYLASTKAIPNHDPSIHHNASSIASYATHWSSANKKLGGAGWWQKAMPSAGGRADLGLMPKWDMAALYDGSAHLHEIAETHSELAGSWRFFVREGSASHVIYGSLIGQGRVLSKISRPTMFGAMSTVPNGAIVDGPITATTDGWIHDDAHTPGFFWFSYLTTGAAIWYEKLMQMAAWSLFIVNPGLAFNSVGNGRSNTDLILNGMQSRAWGWQYRNRARAWWASLNGSPERQLMTKAMEDAAAQRAGLYGISGMMMDHPVRQAWDANHLVWYSGGVPHPRPNPLSYWEARGGYLINEGAPSDSNGYYHAPWMRNFIALSLLHAVELGAEFARPLAYFAVQQTLAVATSTEPRHIAAYTFPAGTIDGGFYQSLSNLYDNWAVNADTASYPPSLPLSNTAGIPGSGPPGTSNVTMESYASIAVAAIAMANGAIAQEGAWNFVAPYYQSSVYYDHDQRYAIIPRR